MQLIIIILFAFLVYSPAFAGTCWNGGSSGSAPWTVLDGEGGSPSAAYADVYYCVNTAASAQDTVNITATGTVTWSTNLVITQGVNLIGPGRTSLTIQPNFDYSTPYVDTSYLITYRPSAPASNHAFRLSGLTLDGNDRSLTFRAVNTSETAKITNFRVDNVGFLNAKTISGTDPASSRITGMFYGVMHNNYYAPGSHSGWQVVFDNGANTEAQFEGESYSYGQSEALFFEDNTLVDLNDEAFDMSMGSKVVIRYNTFGSVRVGSATWMEVHGAQCGGNYAALGIEVYGNNFTAAASHGLIGSRSGKHLVMYNKLNLASYITLAVMQPMNAPDSASGGNLCEGTYDSQSNYHYTADGLGNYPTGYFFMNKDNVDEVTAAIGSYECCTASVGPYGPWPDCCFRNAVDGKYTTGITENTDFYNFNASYASDPTTGVGCGTLASRPATCTQGTAYWATDQSCSTLTGMVGAYPSTPISGTLYICGASNWTDATTYTPYTYPHPLRSGSQGSRKMQNVNAIGVRFN